MKRVSILIVALLVGAAAPARAWCEATCLAPSAAAAPHCPSHQSSESDTSIAAALDADCPVIESARPATAKIQFAQSVTVITWHGEPGHLNDVAPRHAGTKAPRHLTHIPLRI